MPRTHPTVVILTALALEYAAVRSHLPHREELEHPNETGTRVERGRLPGTDWHVALAELGKGNGAAAALTTQIVNWLNPEAILFVGVAGSLKHDIRIGDVVIGTKVYGIHGGKQTPNGFQVRPEAWPVSHALESAARSAVRDMPDVQAHFEPIASGDVVLAGAESEIARHLRDHYNDAAAIEMEGAGVLQAAHLNRQLHALVIRGISDRTNADRHEADAARSQERAATQAASVAVAILRKQRPRKRPLPSGAPPSTERSPVSRQDSSNAATAPRSNRTVARLAKILPPLSAVRAFFKAAVLTPPVLFITRFCASVVKEDGYSTFGWIIGAAMWLMSLAIYVIPVHTWMEDEDDWPSIFVIYAVLTGAVAGPVWTFYGGLPALAAVPGVALLAALILLLGEAYDIKNRDPGARR